MGLFFKKPKTPTFEQQLTAQGRKLTSAGQEFLAKSKGIGALVARVQLLGGGTPPGGESKEEFRDKMTTTIKSPPPMFGPEMIKAKADIKERQRKARGRRFSRLTTPGTLAIKDLKILRPELKDLLG